MLTFVLRGKDIDEVLAVGGELPAKYVEFWSSSGDFPSGERPEANTGMSGFTLPPLPFVDKHSLGRKVIEQVYELASRVAKHYLDRLSSEADRTD